MPSAVRLMTLPEAYRIFRGWRRNPPTHRFAKMFAAGYGWSEPMTMDEAVKAGAMGPEDILALAKLHGGKLIGTLPAEGGE